GLPAPSVSHSIESKVPLGQGQQPDWTTSPPHVSTHSMARKHAISSHSVGLADALPPQQTAPSMKIGAPSSGRMLAIGGSPLSAQTSPGRCTLPSPGSPTTVPPAASHSAGVKDSRGSATGSSPPGSNGLTSGGTSSPGSPSALGSP